MTSLGFLGHRQIHINFHSRIHDGVDIGLLLNSHGDQVLRAGDELDRDGEVIVSVGRGVAGE